MSQMPIDKAAKSKANKEYYQKHKKLKGRTPGSNINPGSAPKPNPSQNTAARIGRLKAKVATLEGALSKAEQELSLRRQKDAKEKKASSDGKSTTEEKKASEKYRDKHQQELKAKEKKDSKEESKSDSKSSSSSTSSSSSSLSDMSAGDLEARISKIKSALADAKSQLSTATQTLGHMAHSAITSEPMVNDDFARFHKAERTSVKMTGEDADFGGYATRNNLRCSDGRTILADAFKHNDGQVVPLVFQHGHGDIENVLGHVKLENRSDGVYCYGYFNETPKGLLAKTQVRHGDLKSLSIFANGLKERVQQGITNAKEVLHGNIREVSLVLAGANPGAHIEVVNLAHSDDGDDVFVTDAYITTGVEDVEPLAHAAKDDKPAADEGDDLIEILNTLNPKQEKAVNYLLAQATLQSTESAKHTDDEGEAAAETEESTEGESTDETEEGSEATEGESEEGSGTTEGESTDESEEGSETTEGESTDESEEGSETTEGDSTGTTNEVGDAAQHDNINQEDTSMTTHNLFDQDRVATTNDGAPATLSHADVKGIFAAVVKNESTLEKEMNAYALEHGITNIAYLFPDAKTIEASPQWNSRRTEWVDEVLSAVRKQPFARIKSIVADITADEARAKGYITTHLKEEEFFSLAKRETTPQTVYKKQRLDRDDVIDITDLDVVAFVKAEMKIMLDEEIAGAILMGDGRSSGDEFKIREDKIRPIASDAELYVTQVNVNVDGTGLNVDALIDAVIANRQYYKGTGTPTFFTSEAVISTFLNLKDGFQRRMYSSLAEVATVLRVDKIVPVEIFDRDPSLVGIMVNLQDYSIGTDRNGQATMFDDFDLNFNKLMWLLETRCSGALTKVKAALVFRKVAGTATLVAPDAPGFNKTTGVVTVPSKTGVVYKNADTNATLSSGAQTALSAGATLNVQASPASGYYFANSVGDSYSFTRPAA